MTSNLFEYYPLIIENYEYVCNLKKRGYKVYILSNITRETAAHADSILNTDQRFDGKIYSCEVDLIKPDPAIYKLLMDKYGLVADETIFFDDRAVNVESANVAGLPAKVFTSINDIEETLKVDE